MSRSGDCFCVVMPSRRASSGSRASGGGHGHAVLREHLRLVEVGAPGSLPTGIIVGTATIIDCTRHNGHYEWHLSDVKRLEQPRKPKRQPQPVWFKPF